VRGDPQVELSQVGLPQSELSQAELHQIELKGAVLVGRRIARAARASGRRGTATIADGELVTVSRIVLRIGPGGLAVSGPDPDVVHTVVWLRVKSLEAGEHTRFEDGSPARSIHLELGDREVTFLVPASVLDEERLRALREMAGANICCRGDPGPRAEVPEPQSAPAQVFVTSGHRQASNVMLPPPPPGSNLAMPPGPVDAGAEASGLVGKAGDTGLP
jgi:hypothetical protein